MDGVEISSTTRYAMLWRTVPDKVLAGANLALRAETADGGSDRMQNGGVQSSRGTVVGMQEMEDGWKYHGDGIARE